MLEHFYFDKITVAENKPRPDPCTVTLVVPMDGWMIMSWQAALASISVL